MTTPSVLSTSSVTTPSKPSIRVIARVRPSLNPSSILCTTYNSVQSTFLTVTQTEKNNLRRGLKKGEAPSITTYESKQTFTFDRIYYTDSDTIRIYNQEIEHLIAKVLNGGATCIMAYGQTGSGKTHTISGNPSSPGIIHTVAVDLMDGIMVLNAWIKHQSMTNNFILPPPSTTSSTVSSMTTTFLPTTLPNNYPIPTNLLLMKNNPQHQEIVVYVTAGEVYQEVLLDLGVTLKEKPKRLTPLTLRRQLVTSAEELMAYLTTCIERRAQGATNKNDQSSRSHAVYLINLEYRNQPNVPIGLLGLIDLAGAEYATATEGRENIRRMEGGKNNLGLMALKSLFRYMGQLDSLYTNLVENNHQHHNNGSNGITNSGTTTTTTNTSLSSLPIFSWHRSTLTKILKPFLSGSIDILINRTKEYHRHQARQGTKGNSGVVGNETEKDHSNGGNEEDDINDNYDDDDDDDDEKTSNRTVSSVPQFTSQDIVLCVTVSPENQDAYQTATALTDGLALLGRVPPEKEITDLGLQETIQRYQQQQNYIYSHRTNTNGNSNGKKISTTTTGRKNKEEQDRGGKITTYASSTRNNVSSSVSSEGIPRPSTVSTLNNVSTTVPRTNLPSKGEFGLTDKKHVSLTSMLREQYPPSSTDEVTDTGSLSTVLPNLRKSSQNNNAVSTGTVRPSTVSSVSSSTSSPLTYMNRPPRASPSSMVVHPLDDGGTRRNINGSSNINPKGILRTSPLTVPNNYDYLPPDNHSVRNSVPASLNIHSSISSGNGSSSSSGSNGNGGSRYLKAGSGRAGGKIGSVLKGK